MAIAKGMAFQLCSSVSSILVLDPINDNMGVLSKNLMVTSAPGVLYKAVTTKDLAYVIHGQAASPFIKIIDVAAEENVTPYVSNPGAACRALDVSPDGTKIACGLTGGNYVVYYAYPGFALTVGPNTGAAVYDIAFSPDGTKVAVALEASPWFKIYDVATNADVTPSFVSPPSGICQGVAWSYDGTMIAVCGLSAGGTRLRVFNFSTGALLLNVTSGAASFRHIAFNPSGTRIAAVTNASGGTGLAFYDTSTWLEVTRTKIAQGDAQGRVVHWLSDDICEYVCDTGLFIYRYSTQTTLHWVISQFTSINGGGFVEGSSARKIAGTVVDDTATPVARRVVILDAKTGIRLGETISDAITGDFEVIIFSPDFVNVVAYGVSGENCRIFGPVTPVAL